MNITCAWCLQRDAKFELVAYHLRKHRSAVAPEKQETIIRGDKYLSVKLCKQCLPVTTLMDFAATKPQINYIEILANDLGLNIKRRNVHITTIVHREIKALDELSISEASAVIQQFKEWKENQRMPNEIPEDPEELP